MLIKHSLWIFLLINFLRIFHLHVPHHSSPSAVPPLPQIRCCTTTGKTSERSTSKAGLKRSWAVKGDSAGGETCETRQQLNMNMEYMDCIWLYYIWWFSVPKTSCGSIHGAYNAQVCGASSPLPWMYSEGYLDRHDGQPWEHPVMQTAQTVQKNRKRSSVLMSSWVAEWIPCCSHRCRSAALFGSPWRSARCSCGWNQRPDDTMAKQHWLLRSHHVHGGKQNPQNLLEELKNKHFEFRSIFAPAPPSGSDRENHSKDSPRLTHRSSQVS